MIQYPNYKDVVSLNAVNTTGAGLSLGGVDRPLPTYAVPRSPSKYYTVLIPGGPVATVAIQAMIPNGTWVTIQSVSLTGTDQYLNYTGTFVDIRANVTAYTSGNVTVWIGAI